MEGAENCWYFANWGDGVGSGAHNLVQSTQNSSLLSLLYMEVTFLVYFNRPRWLENHLLEDFKSAQKFQKAQNLFDYSATFRQIFLM